MYPINFSTFHTSFYNLLCFFKILTFFKSQKNKILFSKYQSAVMRNILSMVTPYRFVYKMQSAFQCTLKGSGTSFWWKQKFPCSFTPFQLGVAFHIETHHLICSANQMINALGWNGSREWSSAFRISFVV